MRGLVAAIGIVFLVGAGVGTASARSDAAGEAATFVSGIGNQVITILQQDLDRVERERRLTALFERAFNTKRLGRFVLGRHWKRATPDQQAAYLDLLPRYVVELYAGRFTGYSGERFEVVNQRSLGAGVSLVNSRIVPARGPALNVGFRVERVGGAPAIVDVMVEGISLILTKRAEFDSVVRREGIGSLINRLRRIVSRSSSDQLANAK